MTTYHTFSSTRNNAESVDVVPVSAAGTPTVIASLAVGEVAKDDILFITAVTQISNNITSGGTVLVQLQLILAASATAVTGQAITVPMTQGINRVMHHSPHPLIASHKATATIAAAFVNIVASCKSSAHAGQSMTVDDDSTNLDAFVIKPTFVPSPPPPPPSPPPPPPPGTGGIDDLPTAVRTFNVANTTDFISRLDAALPGDHIILADGVYTRTSPYNWDKGGTQTAPVIVRAANLGKAEIRFGMSLTKGDQILYKTKHTGGLGGIQILNAPRCKLLRVEITNWSGYYETVGADKKRRGFTGLLITQASKNCLISHSEIHNPRPWTAEELADAEAKRLLDRFGCRIIGSDSAFAQGTRFSYCRFYEMGERPAPAAKTGSARYDYGQTDHIEIGGNITDYPNIEGNIYFDHCLFDRYEEPFGSGSVDVKIRNVYFDWCTFDQPASMGVPKTHRHDMRGGENCIMKSCYYTGGFAAAACFGYGHKYVGCVWESGSMMKICMGNAPTGWKAQLGPNGKNAQLRCENIKMIGCKGAVRVGDDLGTPTNTLPPLNTRIEAHDGSVVLLEHTGTVQVGTASETYTRPTAPLLPADVGLKAPS